MSQEYDIFWKYHNKEDMDKQAVELIESQAKRIEEIEKICLGQIRVIARSRITWKERVERIVILVEQSLKGD